MKTTELVALIKDVLNEKCSSFCCDNEAETTTIAEIVAQELLSKGYKADES
jgi:hypothetical protein